VNRELEAKARALAGLKAYLTNLPDPNPEFESPRVSWRLG
jgi:hypothetical protein